MIENAVDTVCDLIWVLNVFAEELLFPMIKWNTDIQRFSSIADILLINNHIL